MKEVPTFPAAAGVGAVPVPAQVNSAQVAPPPGLGGSSGRPAVAPMELHTAAPAVTKAVSPLAAAAQSAFPGPSKSGVPPVDTHLEAKLAANGVAPHKEEREDGEASPPKISTVLQLSNMVGTPPWDYTSAQIVSGFPFCCLSAV